MDWITVLLLSVILVLLGAIVLYHDQHWKGNLPPGPRCLPIVGHMHIFSGNTKLYKQLEKWKAKYGPLFTVYLGSHPAVVVANAELLQEIFVKNSALTSGRPHWLHFYKQYKKSKGIIWNHKGWKEQRKSILAGFKDFGVGSTSLEDKIITESDELRKLLSQMASTRDGAVDLKIPLNLATSNIICSIVFGERFDFEDRVFLEMVDRLNFNFKANLTFSPPNFLPWTLPLYKHLNKKRFGQASNNMEFFMEFIRARITEHIRSYDGNNTRDVIDLQIQMEKSRKTEIDDESVADIARVIFDLWSAGTETTSTSICWAVLYLLHYPEIQRKCCDEINSVLGTDRTPSMRDLKNLPYTNAILLEVQRIVSVFPQSLVHNASSTMNIAGYTIPENTLLIPFLQGAHQDECDWFKPAAFQPERWLDEEGHVTSKNEIFMPFGVGRRKCLGEQLAKMELFLFLVTILQKFDILAANDELPSLVAIQGVTKMTQPFTVKLVKKES